MADVLVSAPKKPYRPISTNNIINNLKSFHLHSRTFPSTWTETWGQLFFRCILLYLCNHKTKN